MIGSQLIVGQLYKLDTKKILIRCILKHERGDIMKDVHKGIVGGHYTEKAIVHKIMHIGLWRPTIFRDMKECCKACDVFQRVGKLSRRDEMPLNPQLMLQPI